MDDLAALPEITGPAVMDVLKKRFYNEQYYTYFGDFLIFINPYQNIKDGESTLGQMYRRSKPLRELPPHALGVAHRAYRMLVNDVTPQVVLVTGHSGSGKTEVSRSVVSQFLREAGLSPVSGLGPRVVMAQHVLNTLMSARTPANPDSTRGIKMATLYFRPDGQMVSAEMHALCTDKWHLIDRGPGCGSFNVFSALVAGLSEQDKHLYYLHDSYRLLSRGDNSPLFLSPDDHGRNVEMFRFFMASLSSLGLQEQTRNYAGRELSAVVAVLAAILHLSNVDFASQPPTGQLAVTNHHELRAACDLLALRQDLVENELLSNTTFVRGEAVRLAHSPMQAALARDSLLVELYRRLVSVTLARLNRALAPEHSYVDNGTLTWASVIESTGPDVQHAAGGLEVFFRNMAAERVQNHLYDVILKHDAEACQKERVQPFKVKYNDNTPVISAVFGPDIGIMTKLATVTLNPQGSPLTLVTLMTEDKALKKTGCLVPVSLKAAKTGSDLFCIKHSGMGQMTYTAGDFMVKNRSCLAESTRHLLLTSSGNPLVQHIARVVGNETGIPPEMMSPDMFFASWTFQNDLTYLLQTLDRGNLHYIRCVKPNSKMTMSQLDPTLVGDQLKECSLVETARQRKSGYSVCISQEQFVRSFRELAFGPLSSVQLPTLTAACRAVLTRAGLEDRGVALSKAAVFLRYWHVQKLHALKAERMRRITVVQAHVRGFLVRRRIRVRRRLMSPQAMVGRFMHDVESEGRLYRSVHNQTDIDRYHSERQQLQQGRQHYAPSPLSPTSPTSPLSPNGRHPGYGRHVTSGAFSPLGGSFDDSGSMVMTSTDPFRFYSQVINKIMNNPHTLEEGTWAKLIYMERGRQVAKAYVEDRSIIIDGSRTEFDGERFGLGLFKNSERDEETASYRASIMEGFRLKKESDDSISACRLSDQPVTVKGVGDPDTPQCFSADLLRCRGQLPYERTVKIFDMNEFRSKIALDLKQGCFSKVTMQRACALGLTFGRDDAEDLQTPCWLCVVNVKALLSLESPDIIKEAQHVAAKLEVTSPEQKIEKLVSVDAKERHSRGRWARTDQREHLEQKEQGGRHIRHQLRAKGLEVGQHLGYSWQDQGKDKATMESLHHWADAPSPEVRSPGKNKAWAKVETAVKERQRSSVDLHNGGH